MRKKFIPVICLLLAGCFLLCGCQMINTSDKKVADVDFTVVPSEELPAEVTTLIEERKKDAFQMAYSDGQYTYIIIGYGVQPTGGYSIKVNEVYQGENALWVDTDLIGPEKTESPEAAETYPYVVIKIEVTDQTIQFKK